MFVSEVPCNFGQWCLLWCFIQYRGICQFSRIENSDWAIFSNSTENCLRWRKAYIIGCFIVSYKLSRDTLFLNVPYSDWTVDWGSCYDVLIIFVPIETWNRLAILWIVSKLHWILNERKEPILRSSNRVKSQYVTRSGKQISALLESFFHSR